MKKTLLVLASLFMTMGAFADEVVFDFVNNGLKMFPGITVGSTQTDSTDPNSTTHDGDITTDKTATIDGVSFTVSPSSTKNPNRIWTTSGGAISLRVYGGTISFSAPKNIKRIEFSVENSKWADPTADCGTISKYLWTGDAASVVMTINGQCRFKSIKVLYGDGVDNPDPTPGIANTPETAYTPAKALELIAAGEGLDDKVYVKGKISYIKEISTSFGNATFTIAEDGKELLIFRARSLNNAKFAAEDEIKVGDDVIVYGLLVNYEKDGVSTPEMTNGYVYSLNGTASINSIAVVEFDANAPIFNLAGQRVSKDAKGILIQNGKKFVVK